jgi:hypothetical protein
MTIIQRGEVVKAGSVHGLLAESEGRRYRLTLNADPTEAQLRAMGAEDAKGAVVTVPAVGSETLDALFERVRAAGLHVLDASHAQNRVEELYLSTLSK